MENDESPWLTEEDSERIRKERLWLKSPNRENRINPYRDLEWLCFDPKVLDKYDNNPLCSLSRDNISFIGKKGNIVCQVPFINNNGKLMVRAGDYAFVPPKERSHWRQFEISKEESDPAT